MTERTSNGQFTSADSMRLVKYDIDPESGCWIWAKCLSADGYGIQVRGVNGKQFTLLAHRFVYELLKGPIPEGLQLDHLCRKGPASTPATSNR